MKQSLRFTGIALALLLITLSAAYVRAEKTAGAGQVVPGIPVKDTVTLVELGSTSCIPCKMMAPIMDEVKAEYKGRVEVIFIDVWDRANADKAKKFKIMAIPTQVFYDRQGKEAFRHTGFFDKASIKIKLDEILAK